MDRRHAVIFVLMMVTLTSSSAFQIHPGYQIGNHKSTISPFSTALQTLQKQINYTFHSIDLLRRAVTHASFSEENNRALSILGTSIIETSVSSRYLLDDIDISSKILNSKIAEVSSVESSCAVDGMRLALHKIIRVSHKTNSTAPAIVCGAFRAMFGAIALDSGRSDDAGNVFWNLHTRTIQIAAL
ncbi:protein NUCLEAR FUSION DEFECTIVE 2 [Amaranthus tricolor]|uniref:protein NUCLEAR FUSION DEFECTIVE 2 n=1 Tax=Amaranthus tricolor TaxID=29722 RepID=UPI00258516B9|nr:protein NUCLEAR FUSION DEFECTIVE 2 [Amaranthus tricolor]XP_057519081.1 protein NUCLEAR FUSION DEFECTIVE 2 [Amaranthus tricolor]XP_057519082.1 protein NUCLEAR FUSION DEFECTIVE 2 [Amaranthus tricolor]